MGHDQSREQGNHNADPQCVGETLDRAGSIDSEDWSDSESEGEEGQYYQAAGEAANMVESGWRESFQTSFGKDEDLANGDVLTLNCTSQEESVYLSSVGITLKGFSKEVSV